MAGRAARASMTTPSIHPKCSPWASDRASLQPSIPRIRMFGYDWPRFHAAVNDFPAALLLVTVLFDLGAWLTKRDSLKSAALWTLWVGVIGGWVGGVARLPGGTAGGGGQGYSVPEGGPGDAGAHHHGHLHRGARVEAVPPLQT